MASTPLLNEIKSTYLKAYPPPCSATEQLRRKIRIDSPNHRAAVAACEDARRQLEEHLSLLCTSILIGGEQFVREFPSHLYVPVITDILIAAHAVSCGSGDGVNPFVWDGEVGSVASVAKTGKHSHSNANNEKGLRNREQISAVPSSIHYVGFQVASPVELLCTRALALIAGDVPRGSYALRIVKSPETIPVLAAYLSDPDFLVMNEELTEELLKCFLYFTLVAHETCVEANVPRRIVELLLVVEQHHLRVPCVQILSNMLARSRESELEDVWSPVLALLVEALTGQLAAHTFQPDVSATSPAQETTTLSHGGGTAPSTTTAAPVVRTIAAKDRMMLSHFMECIVHALDRLFVEPAAMEFHVRLLEQFVAICVQLLQTSLHISPPDDAQALRSLALSPLVTLYLSNPSFAVPLMIRLRVWEAVCGCMLALVERQKAEPPVTRMAGAAPSAVATATDGATAHEGRNADGDLSTTSGTASTTASALEGRTASGNATGDGDSSVSLAPHNDSASAQPGGPATARGPVLTTDVTTIPFIADELRLLPLLEFLLVLLPCARRGHCHSDYRNTTAPYFRWTWEDDFHNEMECNEALCRRLERIYQQTRRFRSHGRYAMTHGKQRVFYADFLSKLYVSDRKQRHSLHRRPLIAGYVHDSRNAFLHGCLCCATEADPLFTTWANRTNMQLRTADTPNSGTGTATDAVAHTESGLNDTDGGEGGRRGLMRSASAPSLGSNSTPHRHIPAASPPTRTWYPTERVSDAGGGDGRRFSDGRPAAAAAPSETSTLDSHRQTTRSHGTALAGDHSRSAGQRLGRQVGFHSGGAAAAADEEEDEDDVDGENGRGNFGDNANTDGEASYAGSRRSTRVGFSLCSCGSHNSTAPHRVPATRLRVTGNDAASSHNQKHAPVTITILPLEVMLEDPVERLQNDPATRKAFLAKDVLSHLIPTMMPALLSLVDNCVNPMVARHCLTLLLRCLSLSADLRSSVTGEAIEIPACTGAFADSATDTPAGAAAASQVAPTASASGKEKPSKRFMSFRKFFAGGSGSIAPRWQRMEWQTTQTALQCFLPSLRDLFVGLYLTDGVHIVAARQDVFAALKDDMVMADELARVHIAPEFCTFQLSMPSELLMTSADAMVLLMGIFPRTKPSGGVPAAPPKTSSFKHIKESLRKSQPARGAGPTPSPNSTVASAFNPLEKSSHDTLAGEAAAQPSSSPSPLPQSGQRSDSATPSDPYASVGVSAVEQRMRDVVLASPSPPPLQQQQQQQARKAASLSSMPLNGGSSHVLPSSPSAAAVGAGAGVTASPTLHPPSPVTGRLPRPPALLPPQSPLANAQHAAVKGGAGGGNSSSSSSARPPHGHPKKKVSSPLTSTTSPETSSSSSAGCVFTLHQATLLLNYTRQIVSRGPRVCAAAAEIEQAMQSSEYRTMTVLGTSEASAGVTGAVLRTKELVLRLTPAPSCPYHFSFSFCTETFFNASLSLLQSLTRNVGEAPLEAVAGEGRRPSSGSTAAASSSPSPAARSSGGGGDDAVSHSTVHSGGAGGARGSLSANSLSKTAAQGGVEEEDLPIDVKVSVVPKTVDIAALSNLADRAMREATGPYHRLPPPLRALLMFYDHCKERDIELRAVMVEVPDFVRRLADGLREWYSGTVRRREDAALTVNSLSFAGDSVLSPNSESRTPMSGSRHLRLDSVVRGKILRLVCELGATVSRDLGFATLELAPSVVAKQPCSFAKRAKRMKTFGTVRHLVWRPLSISCDFLTPTAAAAAALRARSGDDDGSKTRERACVVMVRGIPLPIVTGVKLRKSTYAALASTTIGNFAAAVAKQLHVPLPPPPPPRASSSSHRRSVQRSPAAVALHAVQERQHSVDQPASSPTLTDTSPCLTSEEFFEAGTGGASRAISPDRILFFINGEPMLSPLTTLLDGIASYADTGFSLRYLVTLDKLAGDSDETHRNKVLMTLPTLPFWFCKHDIRFVVLEEPLPLSLTTGDTLTSLWSTSNQRRCGCAGMEPCFLCSPKHLFEAAPVNGSIALYAILSAITRGELADEAGTLDSSQRRLSSAVVHQLYYQLNMFMLPPLLYASGIGAAVHGANIRTIAGSRGSLPHMVFPTASYALWAYPQMFSLDMRVSILRFFISAQRSLTPEQCRHFLQANSGLLVRRSAADFYFGPEENRGAGEGSSVFASAHSDGNDRRLDVVGLEWVSEEVLRRRRVTLTVDRRNILQSAEQLFALATCTITVDVAFRGEAGIGLGPAMEFYELIAEELIKPRYGLFRTEEIPGDDGDGSGSGNGPHRSLQPRRRSCNPLYPAAKQTPQSLHYWELLGLLLGRLLMMGETSSLALHPLLFRRLLGEDVMANPTPPVTSNLELLDAPLAASLRQLTSMSAAELEACDLYFTIPISEADGGNPATDIELPMMTGGEQRRVTHDDVDEYVLRLHSYYLQTVPDLALLHLRRGLQHTVNPLYLELFSATELGRLFGSSADNKIWDSREHFSRCIDAGHGYHKRSDVVQYLLDVVPQWSAKMQHAFLKFVTGSSAVPFGGLTQAIMVVRRDIDTTASGAAAAAGDGMVSRTGLSFAVSGGMSGANGATVSETAFSGMTQNHSFGLNTANDRVLPTVSTCFLYLKLPQYSSKAVLEERLRFAVCEGSNFFALT